MGISLLQPQVVSVVREKTSDESFHFILEMFGSFSRIRIIFRTPNTGLQESWKKFHFLLYLALKALLAEKKVSLYFSECYLIKIMAANKHFPDSSFQWCFKGSQNVLLTRSIQFLFWDWDLKHTGTHLVLFHVPLFSMVLLDLFHWAALIEVRMGKSRPLSEIRMQAGSTQFMNHGSC